MRKTCPVLVLAFTCSMGIAQSQGIVPGSLKESAAAVPSYVEPPSGADGVYTIYPGTGVPADSKGWTWHEQSMDAPWTREPELMVRNVVVPTLTMCRPAEGTANGTAVIIAPGGAFHFLMMDHEGCDLARRLTVQGITAFVLKYRVQHTPQDDGEMPAYLSDLFANLPDVSQTEVDPPMTYAPAEEARLWGEADGRQAIRFLRTHAVELGIAPDHIGIMGFSAGGGIAVNAALEFDSLSRPDFVGGIYPGYRTVKSVPENLPPLFIAIADNDDAVAPISSARLYETWHKAGSSVELHIFGEGGHGFGMKEQDLLSDQWIDLFLNWMAREGFR